MTHPAELIRISRFLALVLRHKPHQIGLTLDEAGWADVDELLLCVRAAGRPLTLEVLQRVVAENDKQRFAFSEDGRRIRASQGHSVEVELGLAPVTPPELLFHGTATRFLPSIREQGLLPGNRRHVHLSPDHDTAVAVGGRHGRPVVLVVEAERLHGAGQPFFLSDNGVWLTATVPPGFLQIPDGT